MEPGTPPRIEPVSLDDYQRLADVVAGGSDRIEVSPALNLTRTWALHRELFAAQHDLQAYFRHSRVLPPKEREIVILRIGWRCNCQYEFGQHTIRARAAGLTSEQIAMTTRDREWNKDERAPDAYGLLISVVDELYDTNDLSDEVWHVLAGHYDARQIIELISVIGRYWGVCMLMNSLRIQLEPGAPGFPE